MKNLPTKTPKWRMLLPIVALILLTASLPLSGCEPTTITITSSPNQPAQEQPEIQKPISTPTPLPTPFPSIPPAPSPVSPIPEPAFIIVETPVGPSIVSEGDEAIFEISIQTNIAGKIEYRFDWEFDGYTAWSSSSSASHSWTGGTGMVVVRAQARCGDYVSKWSSGKEVTIINPRQPFPGHPDQMKRYVMPDDPAVQSLLHDILHSELKILSDFEALRDWAAWHISYKYDQSVHSVNEYWQLPAETLELRTGDCEDFAILLCSLLRAYGVPANQVYVAVGVSKDKTYHAYLVEKWYQGIWRVAEPQAGAWSGVFLGDWLTSASFETLAHFNDQYYSEGFPTLPAGAYEFQLSLIGGTSVTFERNISGGQMIKASVEWLGKCGNPPEPFNIYGWGFKVFDPSGNIVVNWFGTNISRTFSYLAPMSGKYKVQVYTGGFLPISGRLTIEISQPTPTPEPAPTPTPTPTPVQPLQYTIPAGGIVGPTVFYTNILKAGNRVSGYIQLDDSSHPSDWSYDWKASFIGHTGDVVFKYNGDYRTSNRYDFDFIVPADGLYKLSITHYSNFAKSLTGEIEPIGWQ